MTDSRLNYPTGAPTRVWAGAVTSSSFRVNADVVQTAKAARINVSPNSDMSSPVYTSAYQTPALTTGAEYSFQTLSFDVSGLSAATTYYYQMEFQDAASQGDIVRSMKTAPSGAGAFKLAIGSCADIDMQSSASTKRMFQVPVFRSIALDSPLAFISLGDTPYSEVATANYSQRDLWRHMRNVADFDVMCRTVPVAWCLSDHDYMTDDCSLDTANASTVMPITRQVYSEICPHYPRVLSNLLTQAFTIGRTRHLLLDCYGASTYVGNTCLGAAQLAWLQAQITQAATDGMLWVFIYVARTWTGAVFNGFGDAFTAEKATIEAMISASSVRCVIIAGDAHACAFSNASGYPEIEASGLFQDPSGLSGPYTVGGVSKYWHSVRSMYVLLDVAADNTTWTATVNGDPINSSTFIPTTIGSVTSAEMG